MSAVGYGGVLGSGGALFKGQTSAAHGRGGLVTLSRQSNQRRTRHRKCLFAAQAFSPQNKTEPQAAILCPGLPYLSINLQRTNLLCLCRTTRPCSVLFSPGAAAMTPTGPNAFLSGNKKFVLARSEPGTVRLGQRRGNRKVSL